MVLECTGTMGARGFMLDNFVSVITGDPARGIWPKIMPFLDEYADVYSSWDTKESLFGMVVSETMQLWLAGEYEDMAPSDVSQWDIKSLMFTSIKQYPTGLREMYLNYLMGTDLVSRVKEDWPKLEGYARLQHCDILVADTRPGMGKLLQRDHEFSASKVRITRNLMKGMH